MGKLFDPQEMKCMYSRSGVWKTTDVASAATIESNSDRLVERGDDLMIYCVGISASIDLFAIRSTNEQEYYI